jgi:hypothetical protein
MAQSSFTPQRKDFAARGTYTRSDAEVNRVRNPLSLQVNGLL